MTRSERTHPTRKRSIGRSGLIDNGNRLSYSVGMDTETTSSVGKYRIQILTVTGTYCDGAYWRQKTEWSTHVIMECSFMEAVAASCALSQGGTYRTRVVTFDYGV